MNWHQVSRKKAPKKSFGLRGNNALLLEQADQLCRKLVLLRDGYRCTLCGSAREVQWCHLISRARMLVRHDPENSTALCKSCHARYTRAEDARWINVMVKYMGEARYEALRARAWAKAKPDYASWLLALAAMTPETAPRPWPNYEQSRTHFKEAFMTDKNQDDDIPEPSVERPQQPPTRGIPMATEGPLAVLQRKPILRDDRDDEDGGSYTACLEIASYHPVSGDQGERYNNLTAALADFLMILLMTTHPGPERSTAISRAQEAKFWAAAAIAREKANGQDVGPEADGPAIMDPAAK